MQDGPPHVSRPSATLSRTGAANMPNSSRVARGANSIAGFTPKRFSCFGYKGCIARQCVACQSRIRCTWDRIVATRLILIRILPGPCHSLLTQLAQFAYYLGFSTRRRRTREKHVLWLRRSDIPDREMKRCRFRDSIHFALINRSAYAYATRTRFDRSSMSSFTAGKRIQSSHRW